MSLRVRHKREVLEATCDSCGASLKDVIGNDPDDFNTNYAELKPSFGYGSDLDLHGSTIGQYIDPEQFSTFICAECYGKVIEFLGLEFVPQDHHLFVRKKADETNEEEEQESEKIG